MISLSYESQVGQSSVADIMILTDKLTCFGNVQT